MPKVSVIVPIYKVEKYIERCIRSLFEQTLEDIEYIFIDDKSPDNSVAILKDVLKDYPNRVNQCVIYQMPSNSGLPTVRKQGIYMASGEYIANCDSDDWIDKNMYKIMYEEAVKNSSDIIKCNFARCNEKYYKRCRIIPSQCYAKKEIILSYLLKGYDLSTLCDKLIRRSLFTENPIKHPIDNMLEDYVVMTQLLYYSNKISYIKDVFYYYYQNPESISHLSFTPSQIISRMEQKFRNVNIILDFLEEKGISVLYNREIANLKYSVREELLPLLPSKEYLCLWRDIFPELKRSDLIGVKKIIYMLVNMGIYPVRI